MQVYRDLDGHIKGLGDRRLVLYIHRPHFLCYIRNAHGQSYLHNAYSAASPSNLTQVEEGNQKGSFQLMNHVEHLRLHGFLITKRPCPFDASVLLYGHLPSDPGDGGSAVSRRAPQQ